MTTPAASTDAAEAVPTLAPKLTDFVFDMIGQLRDEGLTVLLVEQKARQTLKIADRAYLLDTGRVVTSGRAGDLIDDPVVSETFLGGRTGGVSLGASRSTRVGSID